MKAQTEAIGLIVIVLIIVIAGVLFLTLSKPGEPDIGLREHTKQSNLVNAILMLTPCPSDVRPLREAIKDCYTTGQDFCMTGCSSYIRNEIKGIMDKGFIAYNNYAFSVRADDMVLNEYSVSSGGCGSEVKVITRRLPAMDKAIVLEFVFC